MTFSKFVSSTGRIEVLPNDVMPLLGKMLDPALFDVTTLIQNGDDNANRPYLPLIVQGESGAGATAAAAALSPALQPGTALPSIDAIAAREPRTSAAREGAALAAIASAAVRAGQLTPQVTRVRYIWLDRTVRASGTVSLAYLRAPAKSGPLDHNLVQIGVQAAWRAGDTGRGVKVAVLDTGVDATQPDLRGQIAATKNFTSTASVADHVGTGTFVAGLAAGTGAAADGQRRGVAFGAKLVIGKVLDDTGSGTESSVIAGMQWAATRARVITMSLGTDTPSTGNDPVSLAVNQLTTADHALFVVEAGDSGPADGTIDSPAAATDALAVGAVDGSDRLVPSSGRGPRPGDNAIKPEITAPGVGIVSDRAASSTIGSPLDALYTTLSGTSTATPQVAGAAALLAALHPSWGPAELTAALVSTARPATGGGAYQLGGGMLDVAAAVTSKVIAGQGVADLGPVTFGATKPVTRILSWTNTAATPVTLHLSANLADHAGHPAPAGTVRLSADQLSIPAGGTSSVTLSAIPELLDREPGLYEGRVVARGGGQVARTLVGIYAPAQAYTLTLRPTPIPGTAAGMMSAAAFVVNIGDPDLFDGLVRGTDSFEVPAGRYWVLGIVGDDTNPDAVRTALTGQPEVAVDKDTTVTLDGSSAVPVTASVTGHPTQIAQATIHVERGFAGQVVASDVLSDGSAGLFAQPTGTVSTGTFQAYTTFRLTSPPGDANPYIYDLYHPVGIRIPASLTYTVNPAEQAALAQVHERFYALDGNTSPVLEVRRGLSSAGFIAFENFSEPAGGSTRTDYLSAGPGISWYQDVAPPFSINGKDSLGDWVTVIPGLDRYAPGSQQSADWVRQPFRPGPYSAALFTASLCAPGPATRSRGSIHVELVDLQDLPDGFDCLGGAAPFPFWQAATSRTMRLYQGSHLIGSSSASIGDFTVPTAVADYKLTYTDDTHAFVPVSTQTQTTWTFRSAPPAGLGAVRIPLLLVDYDLPLGLDNHPDGTTARFSVARVAGTQRALVTALTVWTSTDNGRTWRPAPVHRTGPGTYSATLPHAATGQSVSLRVRAADAGGSGVEQTIMTAYHG